jgi:hypothetical protein
MFLAMTHKEHEKALEAFLALKHSSVKNNTNPLV